MLQIRVEGEYVPIVNSIIRVFLRVHKKKNDKNEWETVTTNKGR